MVKLEQLTLRRTSISISLGHSECLHITLLSARKEVKTTKRLQKKL